MTIIVHHLPSVSLSCLVQYGRLPMKRPPNKRGGILPEILLTDLNLLVMVVAFVREYILLNSSSLFPLKTEAIVSN